MMSIEALVMVILATAAVVLAFTKCTCPAAGEKPRISWLPKTLDEAPLDEDARPVSMR